MRIESKDNPLEEESTPIDISERLKDIIEVDNLHVEEATAQIMALREELKGKLHVKINLDFSLKILTHTKLIKELFLLKPLEGEWEFTVQANKIQGEELKKAFGGLVEVVEV